MVWALGMLNRPSLSLIGLQEISDSDLELLHNDETFVGLALTPSHFGIEPALSSRTKLKLACRRIQSSGKTVNSLQGLLYRIPSFSDESIRERAQWLSVICEEVGCETLVLGAPTTRRDPDLWEKVASGLRRHLSADITISIENICSKQCTNDASHCWPIPESGSFSRAFDFSNALECSSLDPCSLAQFDLFDVTHLSGPSHSGCLSTTDKSQLLSLAGLGLFASARTNVIEIFSESMPKLLAEARKFLRENFDPLSGSDLGSLD